MDIALRNRRRWLLDQEGHMAQVAICRTALLGLGLVFAGAFPVRAADSVILGKRLLVNNPTGDESKRTLIVIGKERPTDDSFNNAPVPLSAILRVILNGASPSDVAYTLGPPGVWESLGPGISGILKYTGGDPVKLLFMKFNPTTNPSFVLKAKLKGSAGPQNLSSLPPNPGTEGGIIFTMDQGSGEQRFCVAFGGAAGGTTTVNDSSMWKVTNATSAPGCPAPVSAPEFVSQSAGANDTVTTDSESDGATAFDSLETSVTTPNAGTVQIQEDTTAGPDPVGYDLVGQHADLTAPSAPATDPLVIVFLVDSSVIPPGQDPATLAVFRDGVLVGACVGGPGVAFPDPCVGGRATVGDDQQITVLSTHASRWTFGLPLCGNGIVDAGEACDPPGAQAQCSVGEVCKSNCQCAVPCDCCAIGAGIYELTTGIAAGNCGTATDANGMLFTNLACNGIYLGGGNNSIPLPILMPDQTKLALAISSCDSAKELLTLTAAPAPLTGSTRTCSTAGCSFGAPVAIPNAASTPTSTCAVFTVAQDASGTSSCEGDATVSLPLSAEIFLTGDTSPAIAGIQSCPLCSGGTCIGGPNNGRACVPANTAANAGYPTSQDCPPAPALLIGDIPIGANFTSGIVTSEAGVTGGGNGRRHVFCSYCRHVDPFTGPGPFQSPAQPCDTDADCAAPFESCSQRSDGAFGPNGAGVTTFSLTGTPATCLADGGSHASTLVGGTCVEPTFSAVLDAAADLPGPAALSLQGNAQLSPPPPPCTCGSPAPTTLTYSNGIGAGNCGSALLSNGTTHANLACGGLYFGGGVQSSPLPLTTLEGTSVTKVNFCTGDSLTLTAASAAETGSTRTCTAAGCLFGPPLPLPDPSSPALSFCVLYSLAQDAAGTANCTTGSTSLDLTLSQAMYLTGDTSADPGIQPCPLCQAGTCSGGPNNGMSCIPAGADLGDAYPTSADCPPSPMSLLASSKTSVTLGNGAVTWNALNGVFCGYCRDADGTGDFENPAKPCLQNGMAVGSPCAQPNESCEQRTNGAFGPNGAPVKTITETGSPAGSLADHAAHAATLASVFCVDPSFVLPNDISHDLPGPGAVTLQGTIQVQ